METNRKTEGDNNGAYRIAIDGKKFIFFGEELFGEAHEGFFD